MSRHSHCYDQGWESEILECPICHWKGKFHQKYAFAQHSDWALNSRAPSLILTIVIDHGLKKR